MYSTTKSIENRVIRKVLTSLEVKLGFKPISFVKKQVKKKKSHAINISKTKLGTKLFFFRVEMVPKKFWTPLSKSKKFYIGIL